MKKLIAIMVLAAGLCASADVTRVITNTWDVARTPLAPINVWFLQAESIQYDLTCLYNGAPYALTNAGLSVVWELSDGENYTNLYAVGTGTVISATSGVVRLTLTPEQSNLTNGTYNGYVIATTVDGTNITGRLVLARQKIIIGWSPYAADYEYVGLSSPYYTKGLVDVMTNALWLSIGTNASGVSANYSSITNLQLNFSATNSAQNIINTNAAYLFSAFTNAQFNTNLAQHTVNTNIEDRVSSVESLCSTGFPSFVEFSSTNSSQHIINTNFEQRVSAAEGAIVVYAGQDTTGMVSSVAADAGKYLKADGTWGTVTASSTNATSFQIGGTNIATIIPSTGIYYNSGDNTLSVTGVVESCYSNVIVSGATTISASNGSYQSLTVTENATVSWTGTGLWNIDVKIIDGGSFVLNLGVPNWSMGDGVINGALEEIIVHGNGTNALVGAELDGDY